YVLYLFRPHHNNLDKRVIKSPKIYFYDTGLACSLLQIQSADQLRSHYLKGGLFENFVINEITKLFLNGGRQAPLYFWQSQEGREVDIILDKGTTLYPFEIKAAKTRNSHLLVNLKYWRDLNALSPDALNLIYGGDENFKTSSGNFISWKKLNQLLHDLGV